MCWRNFWLPQRHPEEILIRRLHNPRELDTWHAIIISCNTCRLWSIPFRSFHMKPVLGMLVCTFALSEDRSEKTVRKGRETRAGMEGRVQEEKLGQSPLSSTFVTICYLLLCQRGVWGLWFDWGKVSFYMFLWSIHINSQQFSSICQRRSEDVMPQAIFMRSRPRRSDTWLQLVSFVVITKVALQSWGGCTTWCKRQKAGPGKICNMQVASISVNQL